MKINWIGPYKPVPDRSGADLRSYYLMRELKRHGASIDGYFLGSHGEDCEPFLDRSRVFDRGWFTGAVRGCWRRLGGEPLTVGRFYHPDLAEALSGPEVVYVDHLHMVPNLSGSTPRYWLDDHNVESDLWEQYARHAPRWKKWLLEVEASRLREYEFNAIRGSLGTSLPSLGCTGGIPDDLRETIAEIPNGVSEDWLEHGRDRLGESRTPSGVFGFIGKYDWFPNRLGIDRFLDGVWASFHREYPKSRLKLAGAGPPEGWRSREGVEVLGYVKDKEAFFESIDALVLPLYLGSGTRLKALEAAARGVPVLGTRKGVEGLRGLSFEPVESIGGLRDRMEEFLAAPDASRKNAQRIHRTVRENYRWETIGDRLWEAIESAC